MFAGIAGGLLVFTGFWHATEWMMDGRRRDTWRLVPVGVVYMVLGALIVMSIGGWVIQVAALLLAGAGGAVAFMRRDNFAIRKWVIWAFVLIDVLVVLALAAALLG